MNIPPDLDDPNAPKDNPLGTPPDFDPGALSLQKKSSPVPKIVIGVLVVGGIGFFVWNSSQTRKKREMHANVMKQFADVEKDEVTGKFLACLFGNNTDPAQIPNNLALAQRVETAFMTDPKNFPNKVREDCTPKAIDARHKAEAITAPAEYDAAFKKYEQSLTDLAAAFDEWAKLAPSHLEERMMGKKVQDDGTAWHAFAGGKPAADVIAYDRFLHCAIPGVDKMKDGQAIVEFLFKECKDQKYLDRLAGECGKEVTAEGVPQAPSAGFKTAVGKFAADDRELQAFNHCLHKGRSAKRSDDSEGIGKAWVGYMQAGHDLREIGKKELAE
jgi:hypothetical protein